MLLRVLYFTFFCLGCSARLLAQTYEPGYLVRSTGDTLRGEIENDFWEQPPTFIRYRRAADSPSELLPARQLRAFSLVGGRYFRHEVVQIDHAAETQLERLHYGNYTTLKADTVLAEVLLEGPVELLRVARPEAMHYQLRRPGRPPLVVNERKYLVQNDEGGWRIVDGNNYRNQVALYFGDCPAASRAADTAPFTAAGLAAVAQAYATECSPGRQPARSWLALTKPRRRGAFQGGVLAGVRNNHIGSPALALAEAPCVGCQVLPFGGLYAELLQPGRTTAIYGELSVSSFQNQTNYNDYRTIPVTSFTYQGVLGTARIAVRYFWPLPHDRQLLLGLGYEYNHVWNLRTTDPAANGYLDTEQTNSYFPSPPLLPNLTLGWRQQRLTLTLDGQLYRSASNSDNLFLKLLVGSNYALRLGLSYRLSRNPDSATPRPQR